MDHFHFTNFYLCFAVVVVASVVVVVRAVVVEGTEKKWICVSISVIVRIPR